MKSEIYDYDERLERYRRIITGFRRNGEVALRFLDHLGEGIKLNYSVRIAA